MAEDSTLRWQTADLPGDTHEAHTPTPASPAAECESVDPTVVGNRLRIAQLRQERVGGATDPGDMLLSGKGVRLGALVVSLVAMMIGVRSPCPWSAWAPPRRAGRTAQHAGASCGRMDRGPAAALRWTIAAPLATTGGLTVMLFAAYWSAPPL